MAARQVIWDQGGAASTIAAFLKEDYVTNEIRSLVNTSTEFLSRIKTKPTDVGLNWVEPIKTATAQGSGARAENSVLPNAGFGRYDRITGTVKSLYGSFYITGESIAASRNNKAAFKSALTMALDDTKEGYKLDLQRQAWGDGNAILGRVESNVVASVTVPVTDPYGLTYVAADLQEYEKVMTFGENMEIWIYTEGGAGTSEFRTITGVDDGAGTITVNAVVTCTAGDVIYRGSSATSNNVGNELTGINGFVDDSGTYFGLARAGRSVLKSSIVTFNGASVGLEDDMRTMNSSLFRKATEKSDMLIIANTRVHDMHVANLTAERRQVNPVELKSGQDAVEFGGKTFVKDKDCPPQRQYWLRMADIFFRQMGQGGWMDEDGNILNRVVDSDGRKNAYEADWVEYKEMVTRAPANHGIIEGIIEA